MAEINKVQQEKATMEQVNCVHMKMVSFILHVGIKEARRYNGSGDTDVNIIVLHSIDTGSAGTEAGGTSSSSSS